MDGETPEPDGERDPRDELGRLARGLRKQAERRRRLGGGLPGETTAPKRSGAVAPLTPKPPSASKSPSTPPAPFRNDRSEPNAPPRTEPRVPTRAEAPTPVEIPQRAAGSGFHTSVAAGPARDADEVRAQAGSAADLDELRRGVAQCRACSLCETRTQTVFQDGEGASGVLFIGEAPGAEEDRTGVPFVGRAGQLLTDIITKGMGIPRRDVWIANVLKCRPPDNREPTPAEKATCTPWLDRQVQILGPKILIPLGRHAAMHVLGLNAPLSAMRGRVHEVLGRPVVPTFHPAYLLRSPGEKKECWKDIQLAMQTAGLPVPPRQSGSGSAT